MRQLQHDDPERLEKAREDEINPMHNITSHKTKRVRPALLLLWPDGTAARRTRRHVNHIKFMIMDDMRFVNSWVMKQWHSFEYGIFVGKNKYRAI